MRWEGPCSGMQTGKSGVALTIASLLAITLAGCSTVGEPIDVEAPSWRSGFSWSYIYDEEWTFSFNDNGERDNDTDSDTGRFVRQVMNTTLEAGDKPVYVLVEQDTDRNAGRLRIRGQADLGNVDFAHAYSSHCTQSKCTGSVDLDFYDDDELQLPPYLDFPLHAGKSWGAVVDMNEYDDGEDWALSIGAAVEGAAMVELPVGVTKAAKINMIVRPSNMAAFQADLRDEAAEEGYIIDALDLRFEQRETIYYSPEYQAIVKRDVIEVESTYARGSDPDGEPFEFSFDSEYRWSELLDGARLAPAPEVAINDLVPYLSGKVRLVDPVNETVVVDGYDIRLTPGDAVINAGAGESVAYRVNVDGAESLPNNHTLAWKVTDSEGNVVQTGDGNDFTAAVDRPGRYTVGVEAKQGNSLVSADVATLTADWIATTRLTCPPATSFGFPACDVGVIPMSQGIKALVVRGVPTGPFGAVIGSSMTVYDSLGQDIGGSPDGDGYKVELTEFGDYFIDGSDWTMEYRHSVGTLSDVDMEITALYSSVAMVSTAMGDERVPAMRVMDRMPW